MVDDVARIQAGDLSRLIIEHGDPLIGAGGDHARRQIFEQRLVINACVLNFGEQLCVIDRHRELAAEHLQRVLLDGAIDAARDARPKQHDAGEMLPGKNSDSHSSLQLLHFFRYLFQLRRGANPMKLIEHERLPGGLRGRKSSAHSDSFLISWSSSLGWSGRIVLHIGLFFRQQDEHPIRSTASPMVLAKRSSRS